MGRYEKQELKLEWEDIAGGWGMFPWFLQFYWLNLPSGRHNTPTLLDVFSGSESWFFQGLAPMRPTVFTAVLIAVLF